MKEGISVIIPVYNGQNTIVSLLNRFEEQFKTFKNFEIIIINDGSIDQTFDKLMLFEKTTVLNIIVLNQSNKGVSAARNAGIKKATGKYMVFVDADDDISSNYLYVLYEKMSKSDIELLFFKSTEHLTDLDNNNKNEIIKFYNTNQALESFLYHKLVSGVWTLIVKRDIILKNELCFPENYKYSEDLYMVWKLINVSTVIAESNLKLYLYKQNEGSTMSKFNESRFDSVILMEKLEDYFLKHNKKFYESFKKYAVARMTWSIAWQAAGAYDYKNYNSYLLKIDAKKILIKLKNSPEKKIKYSVRIFFFSNRIFYFLARLITPNKRKILINDQSV